MPAPQRRSDVAVIAQLLEAPQRFGFFQSVRLLERWLSQGAAGGAGLARIQFRNSLALTFPASEVEGLTVSLQPPLSQVDPRMAAQGDASPGESAGEALDALLGLEENLLKVMQSGVGAQASPTPIAASDEALGGRVPDAHRVEQVTLTPAFMGLLGVAGTMPFHVTEALYQRELYQKDAGPRAFMDVFSHRAVHLFFEAWRKHRMGLRYEADRRQQYLPQLMALAGVPQASAAGANGHRPPDEAMAYFAGALQRRTRSPQQLRALLQHHLGVPVAIEQFVGRWYNLPTAQRSSLGGLGTPAVLGRRASLGERVWQRDLRVRLVLGPLPRTRFLRFLPGGDGAQALQRWINVLCGVSLEFEVHLRLQRDEVQPLTLDSLRAASVGRLGWDTFVQTRSASADRSDVCYELTGGG